VGPGAARHISPSRARRALRAASVEAQRPHWQRASCSSEPEPWNGTIHRCCAAYQAAATLYTRSSNGGRSGPSAAIGTEFNLDGPDNTRRPTMRGCGPLTRRQYRPERESASPRRLARDRRAGDLNPGRCVGSVEVITHHGIPYSPPRLDARWQVRPTRFVAPSHRLPALSPVHRVREVARALRRACVSRATPNDSRWTPTTPTHRSHGGQLERRHSPRWRYRTSQQCRSVADAHRLTCAARQGCACPALDPNAIANDRERGGPRTLRCVASR
jgi:hypothetical protein